jgi:hypothetical protein
MKIRFFYLLVLVICLTSCAGYHISTNNNPLRGYGIETVSVPMFINRASLPELAAPMTREITFALNDYTGIKVLSGDDESADAILIGIIESRDHYNEVVRANNQLFSTGTIQESIGNRSPFYFPIDSAYQFSLRIILIKRPTIEELKLITSELGQFMKVSPKVVLMDTIALSGSFTKVVGKNILDSDPGKTNFVKNRGYFEKNIQETAVNAAKTFKQVILNAF